MKLLLALTLVCTSTIASAQESATFPVLKTTDGKEYKTVTVTRVDPDSLKIEHEDGAASVPLANLPEDLQKRFNFDPHRAAAFTNASLQLRAAAINAGAKVQADAVRLEARFSKWTTELNRLKKLNESSINPKDAKALETFKATLDELRKLVASYDAEGADHNLIKRALDDAYDGKLFKGMPQQFVLYAWGTPTAVVKKTTEYGDWHTWEYGSDGWVNVENERVMSFSLGTVVLRR